MEKRKRTQQDTTIKAANEVEENKMTLPNRECNAARKVSTKCREKNFIKYFRHKTKHDKAMCHSKNRKKKNQIVGI